MSRSARVERDTTESKVRVELDLDGSGRAEISTGVGFYDHMLDSFSRHSLVDLTVQTVGDTHIDAHHTVEDTGIVLGRALDEALGDRSHIRRYGHAVVPMDEARASCAIDVSGRPYASVEGNIPAEAVADFDSDLTEEFLRAVAGAANLTVHVAIERGTNTHHIVEAAFKAFARALGQAVSIDPHETGVPSTKGLL